jgi:hypothetical protein
VRGKTDGRRVDGLGRQIVRALYFRIGMFIDRRNVRVSFFAAYASAAVVYS